MSEYGDLEIYMVTARPSALKGGETEWIRSTLTRYCGILKSDCEDIVTRFIDANDIPWAWVGGEWVPSVV